MEKRIVWVNQNIAWGIGTLILLFGTGIFFTLRLRWIQLRGMPMLFRRLQKPSKQKNGISPLQALSTALAGTIGTGTIAGVAGAISMGGPGAVFWMWVCAFFGAAVKYAEIVLAVRYRKKNGKGEWIGGPMCYMREIKSRATGAFAGCFCLFGVLASFGIGNLTQINAVWNSATEYLEAFCPSNTIPKSVFQLLVGIPLAVSVYRALSGGMQRIGRVTSYLVPWMGLLYLGLAFSVIIRYANGIGSVGRAIVTSAFCPESVLGAGAGISIGQVIRCGVGRGIFSNEAGLGSAPMAYASVDTESPVEQGLYGVTEVFLVTGIVCTATAFTILLPAFAGDLEIPYKQFAGAELTIRALSLSGHKGFTDLLLLLAVTLFAFSTLLTWGAYGGRCFSELFGERYVTIYRGLFCILILSAPLLKSSLIWTFSDLFNALMMFPNLITLLLLQNKVKKLTDMAFVKRKGVEKTVGSVV